MLFGDSKLLIDAYFCLPLKNSPVIDRYPVSPSTAPVTLTSTSSVNNSGMDLGLTNSHPLRYIIAWQKLEKHMCMQIL